MKTKIFTFLLFVLLLSLFMLLLSACQKYEPDYTYTWVVAVVYTNGDNDTITCSRDSFKGNPCIIYLKTQSNGFITSGMPEPCLVTGCGFYSTAITCGVRKYEVLSELREVLPRKD